SPLSPLSLHDALPISHQRAAPPERAVAASQRTGAAQRSRDLERAARAERLFGSNWPRLLRRQQRHAVANEQRRAGGIRFPGSIRPDGPVSLADSLERPGTDA